MALLYRMGTGNGSGGDLKPYIVQFTCDSGYIGQTLTMTYKGTPHAGETVDNVSGTVVLDSTDGKGKLTLYPMHSGNWECSCYSSVIGTTTKKTIELSYWGTTNVEFNDIPNGATVTPTDDVQTWLHCANIWDKSYTTISEVVADTTTLNTLIANENANDYLVRSTTFATDMCADETAMTYIGLDDYCAWSLLDNDTWNEAICNSDYFEKVLNIHLDTLNSSSTEATHGGNIQYMDGLPYQAFDNKESTYWFVYKTNDTTPFWLQYKSDKLANVIMKKAIVIGQNGHHNADIQDITLYRNGDIQLCDTFKIADSKQTDKKTSIIFDNNKVGKSDTYKLVSSVVLAYSSTYYGAYIKELQFYGRERA